MKEAESLINSPDCKTVDDMEDFVTNLHGQIHTMKQVKPSWESTLKAAKVNLKDIFNLFSSL